MGKIDIKIDGFWLFLIGICVVLPGIKYITGYDETSEPTNVETTIKVVSGKNNILEVNGDSAVAPINTKVMIPIYENTVIVKQVSPDRGEPEVIKIKNNYAITSFDKKGSWDIDMYDLNNMLVKWIKVTVY